MHQVCYSNNVLKYMVTSSLTCMSFHCFHTIIMATNGTLFPQRRILSFSDPKACRWSKLRCIEEDRNVYAIKLCRLAHWTSVSVKRQCTHFNSFGHISGFCLVGLESRCLSSAFSCITFRAMLQGYWGSPSTASCATSNELVSITMADGKKEGNDYVSSVGV